LPDGDSQGALGGDALEELVGADDFVGAGEVVASLARASRAPYGAVDDGEADAEAEPEDFGTILSTRPQITLCNDVDEVGAGDADDDACGFTTGRPCGLGPDPDAATAMAAGVSTTANAAASPTGSRFIADLRKLVTLIPVAPTRAPTQKTQTGRNHPGRAAGRSGHRCSRTNRHPIGRRGRDVALDRRSLLKGAAVASGAALLGSRGAAASTATKRFVNAGPISLDAMTAIDSRRSPIEHVVVVMMENRSFDHFLGWLPGANGIGLDPDGTIVDERRFESLRFPDRSGKLHRIYHDTQLNACGEADQDHGYTGGRIQWNHGKMNGFLIDPDNTGFSLSYYLAGARAFSSPLAMQYTVCDNYFCSYLGPTWPNRFFQHAAQTDRQNNTTSPDSSSAPASPSAVATIWDQLNQSGGPTGRYYFSDLPFLALWGQKYLPISAPYPQFLADAAAGNLPNFSVVDPRFEDEGSGTSGDDHPLADLRAGDSFLSEVFHAVAGGPKWANTLLVINYDEWGGFFDHVAPPRVAPGNQTLDTEDVVRDPKTHRITKVLAGFRVPCILVSPFTKGSLDRPRISSYAYDHTSVLRFVEWNWGLHPLTPRDASIPLAGASRKALSNLRYALDFAHPRLKVPDLKELAPFVSTGCDIPGMPKGGPTVGDAAAPERPTWDALKASGLLSGWR
jgi:phospholipase C